MNDTLDFERGQLDRAYTAAEARIAKVQQQIDGGVQAVHNLAARTAADDLRQTVSALQDAISPEAGILLKGKISFADTYDAGDMAGESYYVAIAALALVFRGS